MALNYFDVLGVGAEASADELRKAFHREALKWHPDKNPSIVHQATERFKLIAKAYDALRSADPRCSSDAYFSDSRSGFCYQCAGNPGVRCSCSYSGSGFSMEAALNLFREIFGEDIKDALSRLGGVAGYAACLAGQAAGAAGQALGSLGGQAAGAAGQALGSLGVQAAGAAGQALGSGHAAGAAGQTAGEAVTSIFNRDRPMFSFCCHRRKDKRD